MKNSLIPECLAYTIQPFNEGKSFLIKFGDSQNMRYLKVNNYVCDLLSFVDGKNNLEVIAFLFQSKYKMDFTVNDAYKILFEGQIAKEGIIINGAAPLQQRVESIYSPKQYIKFQVTLLKKEWLEKISSIFTFLFHPTLFILLFGLNIAISFYVFYSHYSVDSLKTALNVRNLVIFYLTSFGISIIHEWGHATACRAFNAQHGDIGFGFYMLSPVFYTDVTDVWILKQRERVIVDLAGLFFESFICVALIIIFYIFNSEFALQFATFLAFASFINLNPLLRYDGYWALSDITGITNLREKSFTTVEKFFSYSLPEIKTLLAIPTNKFLIIYGLANYFFIGYFLYYSIFKNSYSILYLPVNLYKFFEYFFLHIDAVTWVWLNEQFYIMLFPVIFYLMVFRILLKRVKNIISN